MSRVLLMFLTLTLFFTTGAYAQTCADVNGDGGVDIVDIICMLDEHQGGPAIPDGKGDIDFRQGYNAGDMRFLIDYIFWTGSTPGCPPFPSYSLALTNDSLVLPAYRVPAGSGEFVLPIYLVNHTNVSDILTPLKVNDLSGTVSFDSVRIAGSLSPAALILNQVFDTTCVIAYSIVAIPLGEIPAGNNLLALAYFHSTSSPGGLIAMATTTPRPHTFLNYVYGPSHDVGIPKVVLRMDPDIANCPEDSDLDACGVYSHDFEVTEPDMCISPIWSLVAPPDGASIDPATGLLTYDPPDEAASLGGHLITVVVTDQFEVADSCQFTVTVVNDAPVISICPEDRDLDLCLSWEFAFAATDPNVCDNLVWSLVDPPVGATITEDGVFTFDPAGDPALIGPQVLTVVVTDLIGATDECEFTITVINAPPVFSDCPLFDAVDQNLWDMAGELFFGDVDATDPDAVDPLNGCPIALEYTVIEGPTGMILNSETGEWEWQSALTGDFGYHHVIIQVSDGCDVALCEFDLYVVGDKRTEIVKLHDVYQGHYAFDSVFVDAGTLLIGGFDLLIAYDASALNLHDVMWSPELEGTWEYLTYRFGADGNCNGTCPTGLVRLVGIADINNGFYHPVGIPPAGAFHLNGWLANLKFLVTNDRNYECQFVPVRFYWIDCGDNILSSKDGLTSYLADQVYIYVGTYPDPYIEISGDADVWDGYAGWQGILEPDCMAGLPNKPLPIDTIDFWSGGIDIVCADSIDARGDINLNGIANEIADAVLYTQYFLVGISAFPAQYREAMIAASDVNADGTPLSIGDLVYLLRIVVGDALPFTKLAPYASDASISVFGDKISTKSSETIGALYLTFNVTDDNYSVVNLSNMEVLSNRVGDKLNVLVYSGMSNLSNAIAAGSNELLSVTGAELNSVEVSDYYGNLLNTRVAKTALPTQFSLSQNVPNPFNPTTKIGLDLPSLTNWQIDIYNINGQLVQSYNGTNIGHVEVTWDASNTASGIYFYKVTAGSFTDTKKMVLMK